MATPKTKKTAKKRVASKVIREPITTEISKNATKINYPAKRRHTKYSLTLATKLCESISLGNSLTATCRKKGFPSIATFYRWYVTHPELKAMYDDSKLESADSHADKIVDISEQVLKKKNPLNHNNARVASDNYKWLAGVHQPVKYGKSITLNRGIDYHSSEIVDLERMLIESDQRLKRIQGAVVATQPSQDSTDANLPVKANTG